jgi:hypothetical protein
MVNAVVSGGEIRPLEPLPADWRDSQRLRVEKADDGEPSAEEIDHGFAALAALCEARDPADEEALDRAVREAKTKRRRGRTGG